MDSTLGTALSGLLGTIVALAIVLGLAWVSLRALKQWQERGLVSLAGGRRTGEPEHQLRFVRALPVGRAERLVIVEAKGELMLIGVSGGSVNLLKNWGTIPPRDDPAAALGEENAA